MTDVPDRLRRFLPERQPGPTPEEAFQVWTAEHGSETDARAERWRVRSSPSAPRTWVGIAAAVGIGLAVVARLVWQLLP